MKTIHTGAWEKREEEGAAEKICYKLIASLLLFPISLHCRANKAEPCTGVGKEVEPGRKRGRWQENVFRFFFLTSHSI